jgi:hypothetical protein
MSRFVKWCALAVGCVVATGAVHAQNNPKPGAEMEHLKKMVGTWDAMIKSPAGESKGSMTYKMDLGDTWLIGDFKGDFGGAKFEGRGMDTYDANKKKFVGVWIDSMSASPMVSEGAYDPAKKLLVMTGEGTGMDGKPQKMKMTTEMKDNDNMVFTMSGPGPDGKDMQMMQIVYKRKK